MQRPRHYGLDGTGAVLARQIEDLARGQLLALQQYGMIRSIHNGRYQVSEHLLPRLLSLFQSDLLGACMAKCSVRFDTFKLVGEFVGEL